MFSTSAIFLNEARESDSTCARKSYGAFVLQFYTIQSIVVIVGGGGGRTIAVIKNDDLKHNLLLVYISREPDIPFSVSDFIGR